MGQLRRIRRPWGGKHPPPTSPLPVKDNAGCLDLDIGTLEQIIERSKRTPLSEQDCQLLRSVVETLHFLTQELEKKHVSIQKLKQMLFGVTTESTRKVLEKLLDSDKPPSTDKDQAPEEKPASSPPPKAKGHGRNGADTYSGAQTVHVKLETLKPGDPCPACHKGTVYTTTPSRLVRIRGQAPLGATVYELQKLRCGLCGAIFTAPAPPEVGSEKYNAEAAGMIALLKYGSGVPFNRLQRLQRSLEIPLPATTQWQIVQDCADTLEPVFEQMIYQAAQGRLLHNDDTTMKVLELCRQANAATREDAPPNAQRKGMFTSGIVSVIDDHRVALFFTGHCHAGENLAELLKQRQAERQRPIQMCDALSRNAPDSLKTILGHCLTHGRRYFVEVVAQFPNECLTVLEVLKAVYQNDADAQEQGLSDEERLVWHQTRSGPKMAELKRWMTEQIEYKKVEPNSGLGEAIGYMLRHWEELTLFLRQPGAPLDNNVCERALKKAILHRKNAYFYKTLNGAHVGDLFMSLIHTCELNKVNPFDYLVELQKNAQSAASTPADWMPWNYRHTLQRTATPK